MVPFTDEEFFSVFSRYNSAIWPAQLLLLAGAVAAVWIAALRQGPRGGRAVWRLLGLLWLWSGIVYHLTFFTAVTGAAWVFGALFVLEGLLLLRRGIVTARARPGAGTQAWRGFHVRPDLSGWVGSLLAVYALAVYPLLIDMAGHAYPAGPTFGAPCPVAIFTFALFLWADPPVPPHLLVIPFLWALIGGSAALSLSVWPDVGLTIGGVAATAIVLVRSRTMRRSGWPTFDVAARPAAGRKRPTPS